MAAVANNPSFAKKVGVPQSVGKDFDEADKGKKFGSGGAARPDVQKINKSKTEHGKSAFFKRGGDMASSMGKPVMKKGMSMAKDGMKKPTPMADTSMMGGMGMKKGGMAMKKMAMGGSASARADGVATKGKTKGKMLAKGGATKKYC
jgi:hypothetical protein